MASVAPKKSADDSRIGEYAAIQPVSGVLRVVETTAVHGLGRAAFVRTEEAEKSGR